MKSLKSDECKNLNLVLRNSKNLQVLVLGSSQKEVVENLKNNGNQIHTSKDSCDKFDTILSMYSFDGMSSTDVNKELLTLIPKLKVGGKLVLVEECARYTDIKVEGKVNSAAITSFVCSSHINTGGKTLCFEIEQQFGFNQDYEDPATTENSCWVFHLVERNVTDGRGDFTTFQQYLDQSRYSHTHILRYEVIFGKDFVSTGGPTTTKELTKKLDIKEGCRILDVGCGIGGSAFYFIKEFKAEVFGFDLSENMIEIARNKNREYKIPGVKFVVADALKIDFEPNSFDIIYSRDTILHIPEKDYLFKQFNRWLKPGGQFLISDYGCNNYDKQTENFKSYIAERGYTLYTVEDYAQKLRNAGFNNVKGENITKYFLEILQKELDLFLTKEDFMLKNFSQKDFDDLVEGWKEKLVRCGPPHGEQAWGLWVGNK